MARKIGTKDELLKYLLYAKATLGDGYSNFEICVGIRGDEDISDELMPKLKRDVIYLLSGLRIQKKKRRKAK